MVIVRLWGGLGNQMFQFACGYSLAKKNSTDLVLDTRFYTDKYISKNPRFTKQSPNILRFPLKYSSIVDDENELGSISFFQNRTVSRLVRIFPKFNIKLNGNLLYCKETRLTFLPYVSEMHKQNVYLDGYWQCEKYFSNYSEEIRRQFSINSESAYQTIKTLDVHSKNAVAIHVRLGDYGSGKLKLPGYNTIVNPQYYIDAINEINKYVANPRLFVFSNDICRAKELLKNYPCVYVNQNRELDDLEEFGVMSACTHHIISNSTFSWWAAWLNNNGYTIAPDRFVGNTEIIPAEWISISTEK